MISFSAFPNTHGRLPDCQTADFAGLVEFLEMMSKDERPATQAHKLGHTPTISPAVYRAGATRANAAVTAWGGWYALDVDDYPITVDEAGELMAELGSDYAIYTTTKSTQANQRFRIVAPVDRHILANEIEIFWTGLATIFGDMIDPACKDRARVYYVPATWLPSSEVPCPYNRFLASVTGLGMNVDEIIAAVPDKAAVPVYQALPTVTQVPGMRLATNVSVAFYNIWDAKIVPTNILDRYAAEAGAGHYTALYRFMSRVAVHCVRQSIAINVRQLVDLASQANFISAGESFKKRQSGITNEAANALSFAESKRLINI